MTELLIVAIVCIFFALLLYSIGVWSQNISGRLKIWHAGIFWLGLIFDTTGTILMARIAGKIDFDFHGITGLLAIGLMFINAVWATVVVLTKKEAAMKSFHKFSLIVWIVWLIPFVSGMLGAMIKN